MSARGPSGTRITLVTAGHVSSCPRMLKAADALACAGYTVRVVSVVHTPWATRTDAALLRTRRWRSASVDYSAATGRALRRRTGVRFRTLQAVAAAVGPRRMPTAMAIRAYSRVHDEIVREVVKEPADLVYGGSTGALAAVAESARRLGVPYGIDFEDLHSAESEGPRGDVTNALAARVEGHVIAGAAFATAGSPMIAEAYAERYGIRPLPIHNTFSIAPDAPAVPPGGALRLYWFSQTLGPGRGLEDVIRAAGCAGVPIELHLRANPIPEFLGEIRRLGAEVAPMLEIVALDLIGPDEMVKAAQPYDAGLAVELTHPLNRSLCLTNKIFTYLAAGVPVVLSRTPAQARLERDLGSAAFGYECGDIQALGRIFRDLAGDTPLRAQSRAAARAAAARRWHWEHPEDRGALLAAVGGVS